MTLLQFHVRPALLAVALAGWMAMSTAMAGAPGQTGLRLIMVEQAGCPFCLRWDREVGSVYASTPEGKAAPLLRVPREAPEIMGFKPVVFTPTFIVVRGDREIGRITGYPGESYYWEELGELLKGAGYISEPAAAKPNG